MRRVLATSVFILTCAVVFAARIGFGQQAEPPLTNADVIKLAQIALGDDVVIGKVRQAPRIDFDLTTAGLESLKAAGLTSAVITEMLKRATPASTAPSATPVPNPAAGRIAAKVTMIAGGSERPLVAITGTVRAKTILLASSTYFDYHVATASTRITDKRPSFMVEVEIDPRGYFYVVTPGSDRKNNRRPLNVGTSIYGIGGHEVTLLGRTEAFKPDSESEIPSVFDQIGPGKWRITLKKDLKPGEYGIFLQTGDLFDFGVDK